MVSAGFRRCSVGQTVVGVESESSFVVAAGGLAAAMVGIARSAWRSEPSQINQMRRAWPFFGVAGFVRIWRAQLAITVFACLLFLAALALSLGRSSSRGTESTIELLATAFLCAGFLLILLVMSTGRPRVLVPPGFRGIDLVKVKRGGYPQSGTTSMGAGVDMAIYLLLIPELAWYVIGAAGRLSSVVYAIGALVLFLLGLGLLRLALANRKRRNLNAPRDRRASS
jgi:hypothetical protein